MKTKVILIVIVTAILTVSFTFVRVRKQTSRVAPEERADERSPIGGFAIVDKN